jgi:hypothetical protein
MLEMTDVVFADRIARRLQTRNYGRELVSV